MRIVGRTGSESGRRCQMRAGRWEGREGSSSANLEPPPPGGTGSAAGTAVARKSAQAQRVASGGC